MKKKFNQCYDISQKNVDYLNISIKRSLGKLPHMEVAKAYSHIINKIKNKKKDITILDVGCLSGHFNYTFTKKLKNKFTYTGIDPWKLHIDAANKIWKKESNMFKNIKHGKIKTFDSSMIYFPCPIIINKKIHIFYSANNFGKSGMGLLIQKS